MRHLLALLAFALAGDDDDDDKTHIDFDAMEIAAPAMRAAAPAPRAFSATVGGLQDIAWLRAELEAGRLPPPEHLHAEGLLSEHDLPPRVVAPCPRLLCVVGEAAPMDLPGLPEGAVLAQLGFSTSLSPDTWERPPLNLVVVVDQSASMAPAEAVVRASLLSLSANLGAADQLTLITVDDEARLLLPPTPGDDRVALIEALRGYAPRGQTRLFDGVALAFAEAVDSARAFPGLSRVILLSDQRPTAGARDLEPFVELARSGARAGVGLTAVAVGEDPDPELLAALGRVRGANARGFPDLGRMVDVFSQELDTLAVVLATDLALEVSPASGWRLVGVFGVPGEALTRDAQGAVRLFVETLFLSRKGGAIYLALAPEALGELPAAPRRPGSAVATVGLSYAPLDGPAVIETLGLAVEPGAPSPGLARGGLLVTELLALQGAMAAGAGRGDAELAREELRRAIARLHSAQDPDLDEEIVLLSLALAAL